MRIGLAGTGRIGAFHAKTLTTLEGVDDLVLADLDTAARASGSRPTSASSAAPEHRRPARLGPRRVRHHRGHRGPRRAARGGHRPRHPDLLREAGRARPRADHRAHRARGREQRARAHRLPAPLRPGLPAGARRGRVRRAGLHPHRARRDHGPGAAARCLPADLRRTLPRLHVHDFDILRFVTGHEVSRVFAAAPTRATRSSPRPVTSTPPPRRSCSTTAPSSR